MFVTFFHELKSAGVPVTLREYLTLMEAMEGDLASRRVEEFYYLSRAALVKDERNLDKFDRVFGHVFKGLELLSDSGDGGDPGRVAAGSSRKSTSPRRRSRQIEALGGLDKLMETLRQRLKEQKGRHQGGNKWIGTGGTSPFGAYGYNPEGVRIGQDTNRNFRAVKVWDKREFRDLDGNVELGTRNIKVALRRLRKFARTGAPEELDLDDHHQGHRPQGLSRHPHARRAPQRGEGADLFRRRRARWTGTSSSPRSCSRRCAPSSSTWSISTSTTASTSGCGRRIAGAATSRRRPGTCCTPIPTTTR